MKLWRKDPETFWRKVDKAAPGGCWEWTGRLTAGKSTGGYGTFGRAKSVTGDEQLAHRISWVLANGEIPAGLSILHRCDNRKCVNPDHLFLGTQLDNMRDMLAKGRQRWVPSGCKGSGHGMHKITEAQAEEIRRRYEAGGVFQRELAEEFGLHQTMVSLIVRGKNWRHVG